MVVVLPVVTVVIIGVTWAAIWLAMAGAFALSTGVASLAQAVVSKVDPDKYNGNSAGSAASANDFEGSIPAMCVSLCFFLYNIGSGVIFGMNSIHFAGLQASFRDLFYGWFPGGGLNAARILAYLTLTVILTAAGAFAVTLFGLVWRQTIDRLPGFLPDIALSLAILLPVALALSYFNAVTLVHSLMVAAAIVCWQMWSNRNVVWAR